MLIPRFTIRSLLIAVVLVSAVSLVGGSAFRELWRQASKDPQNNNPIYQFDPRRADDGQVRMWSVGVSAAVVSLALVFGLYAAVFLAASPLIVVKELAAGDRGPTTPFATAEPPPQVLPPPDPE